MAADTTASNSGNLILVGSEATPDAKVFDTSVTASPTYSPQQRIDELGRLLLEFRLTADKEAERSGKTLKQLTRQVFWLKAGLFLALLGISGSLVGSSYALKAQQGQLSDKVAAIAAQDGPEGSLVSRLETLEKATQQLEENVPPDLSNRVKTTQSQLDDLAQTVSTLERNLDQRNSVTAVLANALQSLVEDPSGSLLEVAPPTDTSDSLSVGEEPPVEESSQPSGENTPAGAETP